MKISKWLMCTFLMAMVQIPLFCGTQITLQEVYKLQDKEKLTQLVADYEPLVAQKKNESFSLKLVGIAYHNLAVLKVGGAPEKSVTYLQRAVELNPTDNEALAFLGSATTMVARDSWNFFTKLSDVNKGINLLDKAVSRDSSNCVIRVVRGNNAQNLPDFLGRKKIAKQDFLKIEQLLMTDKTKLDSETASDVYYKLGLIYKDEKDFEKARTYFSKAINTAPLSQSGRQAKNEL